MEALIHGLPAARSLEEVRRIVILSESAKARLPTTRTPEEFFQQLLANDLHADASRTLAHLLPTRLSIWWGCLCAYDSVAASMEPAEDDALRRATQWVANPTEANRELAQVAAFAAGLRSAAGCCAAAVVQAGSANRADAPLQTENARGAAGLIGAAVQIAVHRSRAAPAPISFRQLTFVGLDVAAGKFPWGC